MKFKIKTTGPKRIDIEFPVKCPACGKRIKISARNSAPGKVIRCSCGKGVIKLDGDDPRKVQRAFDGLLDAFHKLGK